jgi:signal peptidase II
MTLQSEHKQALRTPILLTVMVLVLDQTTKFWVKTNMYLNQEIKVFGDWAIIHFTENPGMAFGMELGGDYGKLALSLFRIVAVFGLAFYIYHLIKTNAPKGLVASISLIFAGAIGNIIDSVFYGILFSESYYNIAEFLPAEGGYGTLLHGKVVDMIYLPIIKGNMPDWVPFMGGDYFIFFRPIFNLADTAISVGVGIILLFQRSFFKEEKPESIG